MQRQWIAGNVDYGNSLLREEDRLRCKVDFGEFSNKLANKEMERGGPKAAPSLVLTVLSSGLLKPVRNANAYLVIVAPG